MTMGLQQGRPFRVVARGDVASRLRAIREELHGEDGGARMAALLGFPPRTWRNYEDGVAIPGEVLLKFLDLTGVDPHWLLRGEGERFRETPRPTMAGKP